MPFGAALSQHPVPAEAVGEVLGEVLDQTGPEPDLAVLFVTAPLTGALEDVAATVRSVLRPRTLLGATAVSVVGRSTEAEEVAAVSLWAGSTGAVSPVRIEADPVGDGFDLRGVPAAGSTGTLVALADPFSMPVDQLLRHLRESSPGLAVVGGMASAARGPGGNRLVLDSALHHDGIVAVHLPPEARVRTVVSQGCRPIGDPMIVTRAERNVVYELAGKPALDQLVALATAASDEDRALLQEGLHVGVVVDETKAEFERGDFLVRGVLGADRENGAVAIGDQVPVGTTLQFQVRDAASADEDLRALLAESGGAAGALVFTCNGRGERFFGERHHDAQLVAGVTADRCAGMFCAGELGPVGGRSFAHGFTASIALFD